MATDSDVISLPKAELHCHLGLVMDPAMLRTLQERGHRLPISPEAAEAVLPLRGKEDFIRFAGLLQPLRVDFDLLKQFPELHIERLKAQNVIYAEIMIGITPLPGDADERLWKMRALREIANATCEGKTSVGFIAALPRTELPEAVEESVGSILQLYEARLIVGVALMGEEQGYPVRSFRRTFAQLREAGLGIEIHAGEWSGPESVRESLEYGFPDRIGHGVAVFQDPDLATLFRERQIHIEMCPTSNLKTGAVTKLQDHPLRRARDLGLNFSINTDDPGAFECSIESEYLLAATEFGFDAEDFWKVTANALRSRFHHYGEAR